LPELDDSGDTALLEAAVRQAGALARTFLTGQNKIRSKPDGSPVSEADLAVDRFLTNDCGRRAPTTPGCRKKTRTIPRGLWRGAFSFVDPIDGTVAFLKGRPHFTIVAAVVEGEIPIAAAVYNPLTEECFTAVKDRGAWLNGAPIRVSGRDRLEGCRMLASKSTLQNPCWGGAPWPPMTVETPNSMAYRVALVACGAFDASVSLSPTHDWDLAAADLIVQEAGGLIFVARGNYPALQSGQYRAAVRGGRRPCPA